MFKEIVAESFDEREKRILAFWKEKDIFNKSVETKKKNSHFSFYDGPPFATGLPHYGHLLAGTIKDVVLRYKTMKGYYAPRRFGWDCHGLPIENEIEKLHDLSGAASIEEFGIARFNEECRNIVLRYTEEWKATVERMGRWVDFSDTWHTMDRSFMESVWWAFKELYDKGLIYEGYKVMPFSAKLGTPLSNFEAGENYKDVDDPSLTLAFPLKDEESTFFLVWTTTPWTLPSNLAIMVAADADYVKIEHHKTGKRYILAKSRLPAIFPEATDYAIVETVKGRDLYGIRYRPLFNYFAHKAEEGAFRVIFEENVTMDEGTGLVHCAPAFGETDFYAAQKEGIVLVCPVDNNGNFTHEVPDFAGSFVRDADKEIIRRLKAEGFVFHHATLRHRYPFCYRSDTPLIYKAITTSFVAVEKIKDRLVAANKTIHWMPSHIKEGRFGKWLEGARDWAISRNRYWGTPIPLWRADDGEIHVIGSVTELEKLTGKKIDDLHRHFIDDVTFEKDGKVFHRIKEVFDCWFESGSMPYAQNHYPFENRELFKDTFPADFIGEGLDQTRGWFYTLMVLSTALFDQPAFKNVIVNGIVLAEDGAKMSKRLRNYPDPSTVIHKYGADAIRLYLMNSPAVKADNLCFSESGVELVLRQVLIPWWNAFTFFTTYARINDWLPSAQPKRPLATIDQWIISKLHGLVKSVEEGMDEYNLSKAVEPFVGFVDQLTNWYIRRSRRRFWSDEASPDRDSAFETLYQVLVSLTKIAAPYVPFIAEAIWQQLRSDSMEISVHLASFPNEDKTLRNEHLEAAMEAVQTAVALGHSLRKEHKVKVRQPLAQAFIASNDEKVLSFLKEQQHLIAEELNVKEIVFSSNEDEFVELKAKPNFRILGKKVGKLMPEAQKAIVNFTKQQLNDLLANNDVILTLDGSNFTISSEDVQVERIVHEGMVAANEGHITVALDTQLSEPLKIEGLARELVNKINAMRRDHQLAVTDRIHLVIDTSDRVQKAFEIHGDYINNEVLALSVAFAKPQEGSTWELNDETATIQITKA